MYMSGFCRLRMLNSKAQRGPDKRGTGKVIRGRTNPIRANDRTRTHKSLRADDVVVVSSLTAALVSSFPRTAVLSISAICCPRLQQRVGLPPGPHRLSLRGLRTGTREHEESTFNKERTNMKLCRYRVHTEYWRHNSSTM